MEVHPSRHRIDAVTTSASAQRLRVGLCKRQSVCRRADQSFEITSGHACCTTRSHGSRSHPSSFSGRLDDRRAPAACEVDESTQQSHSRRAGPHCRHWREGERHHCRVVRCAISRRIAHAGNVAPAPNRRTSSCAFEKPSSSSAQAGWSQQPAKTSERPRRPSRPSPRLHRQPPQRQRKSKRRPFRRTWRSTSRAAQRCETL